MHLLYVENVLISVECQRIIRFQAHSIMMLLSWTPDTFALFQPQHGILKRCRTTPASEQDSVLDDLVYPNHYNVDTIAIVHNGQLITHDLHQIRIFAPLSAQLLLCIPMPTGSHKVGCLAVLHSVLYVGVNHYGVVAVDTIYGKIIGLVEHVDDDIVNIQFTRPPDLGLFATLIELL
jgi:hypothetical protein